MSETGDMLEDEAKENFNSVVLFWSELGRIVGYGEDDTDCYYIAQHMRPKGLVWHSCVGGFFPLSRLKGQGHVRSVSGEDWDDYYRLDNFLSLNGAPKAETFVVQRRQSST